jgi:hypothetical protein
MQSLYFSKRKVKQAIIIGFQHDLIITENESNLLVMTMNGLWTNKFEVDKYRYLSFSDFVFFYA